MLINRLKNVNHNNELSSRKFQDRDSAMHVAFLHLISLVENIDAVIVIPLHSLSLSETKAPMSPNMAIQFDGLTVCDCFCLLLLCQPSLI